MSKKCPSCGQNYSYLLKCENCGREFCNRCCGEKFILLPIMSRYDPAPGFRSACPDCGSASYKVISEDDDDRDNSVSSSYGSSSMSTGSGKVISEDDDDRDNSASSSYYPSPTGTGSGSDSVEAIFFVIVAIGIVSLLSYLNITQPNSTSYQVSDTENYHRPESPEEAKSIVRSIVIQEGTGINPQPTDAIQYKMIIRSEQGSIIFRTDNGKNSIRDFSHPLAIQFLNMKKGGEYRLFLPPAVVERDFPSIRKSNLIVEIKVLDFVPLSASDESNGEAVSNHYKDPGTSSLSRPSISPEEAKSIAEIDPIKYPGLPSLIAEDLVARGCKIPLTYSDMETTNAITGQFMYPGQLDWSVMCVRNETLTILLYPGGEVTNTATVYGPIKDQIVTHIDDEHVGYTLGISAVGRNYIMVHYQMYGGPKPPPIDHQGINVACCEKTSFVLYWYKDQWFQLQGAD